MISQKSDKVLPAGQGLFPCALTSLLLLSLLLLPGTLQAAEAAQDKSAALHSQPKQAPEKARQVALDAAVGAAPDAKPAAPAEPDGRQPAPAAPKNTAKKKKEASRTHGHASKKAQEKAPPRIELRIEGQLTEAERANIYNFLTLSRLNQSQPLTEGMFQYYLDKAKEEAAAALEPFGYYQARISVEGVQKKERSEVRIKVQPGEAVRVSSAMLEFMGEGAHDRWLLRTKERFSQMKGEVFHHSVYEERKNELLNLASERGFPRARFTESRVELWRSQNRADILLRLDTGPKYTISSLNFTCDILDESLLSKISPVRTGEALSPSRLTAVRQVLYDTGYFSQVDISYDIDSAENGQTAVEVLTAAAPRNRYGVGLGYGTDTGMRGTLAYTNRYLNRRGHQLDLLLRPSEILSNYAGMYTIPIGDPRRDKLMITSAYQTESFGNIDTTTWFSKISREHKWRRGQVAGYLQYLDEDYDTGMHEGHASMLIPGLSGELIFADNRMSTTHGLKLWAALEGSQENILADTSFLQLKGGAKAIITPFANWRLIATGQLGLTWADELIDLPIFLRFFAGGDQSLRGYGYKRIAPHNEQGGIEGGKDMFLYSVELERTLFDGLALAAFCDNGAVANDVTDYDLKTGVGLGLHWNAPFGQLRFDLAVPTDNLQMERLRIHLTLGSDL